MSNCWQERVNSEAAKSPNPEAALELLELMREISEGCWCAGWMGGLEEALGSFVFYDKPSSYGMNDVTQEDINELRRLHEASGGWWHYEEDVTFSLGDLSRYAN